jgi:cysteine desulfuration protein SufE
MSIVRPLCSLRPHAQPLNATLSCTQASRSRAITLRHGMTQAQLDTIRSDFAILDDWEDRYRYVIELGRALPPFPDAERTDSNKVRGCASQVWLASKIDGQGPKTLLHLEGDSDALIVRGLVAILLAIYHNKTADEILATDANAVFSELGLGEHLTPQRSNGFASMVTRIRSDAQDCLSA